MTTKTEKNTATGSTNTESSVTTENENTFDPARLRLTQDFSASIGVKKRLTVIQVRKPGKQEFIRVHPSPEFRIETAVLEFKEDNETYLVDPSLWSNLPDELIPKILYTTLNRQGVLRLWPIRLPDPEGKLDDWNQSALESAEIAKKSWVRVSSNRSAGMYETFEATGNHDDPEWPDITFPEILKTAFKNQYIDNWDHPALLKLRGES